MKNKSSIEQLKLDGLVTTADKIEPKRRLGKNKVTLIEPVTLNNIEEFYKNWITPKSNNWIKEIENYCSIEGILPEDLILAHKEAQQGIKKKKLSKDQQMVKDAFKAAKNHSNWNEQYKKSKLGL